jgi:outer membrane biosynthesis protein TonB
MKMQMLLCVSLLMATEAQAQSQCSQEPLRPIMRSRVMPPNPGQVHGVTRLEIHLGEDGAPDFAKILHCNPPPGSAEVCQSSVTPEMDELARHYVMTYWR